MTPTQGYLDWRANLKPGYYWIENIGGLTDTLVHRIVEIVEIKPATPSYDNIPSKHGYWRGNLIEVGLYICEGTTLHHPDRYCSHWEGFRAEPVKPMSPL